MPLVRKFAFAALAFVALSLSGALTARADVIFIVGPTSAADENVLFNGPGTVSTGNPVTGRTNQTDQLFNISSNVTLTTPAQGQARVERSGGGTFNTLTFQFANAGTTFTELDFNVNAATAGAITFTVTEINGQVHVFNSTVDPNGQNFFSFESHSGQFIRTVSFTTTAQVSDVRQIRVGGVGQQQPIPEPVTMILFGTGLAGVAARVRRRRKA